jgi:uncharacterized membrane protein YdjX (TVP38/TMEM64 family)
VDQKHSSKTSRVPLIISILVLAILAGCYFFIPSFQSAVKEAFETLTSEDEARIQAYVSQFGMLGPLVIIVAMVLQMFLFVIPNILLMMIAILSYGPVWGSLISLTGVFAASSLGYFIGSKIGPVTLNKLVSVSTQQKITQFIQEYGVGAIVITRLSSFSNDGLSIVAGLLKMTYRKYILSTLAGITPLIIMLAFFGKNGKIEKALIWISAVSLVLLILYIVLDKRRKKRMRERGFK